MYEYSPAQITWEIYPITKNRQEKYLFIGFSLKYVRMSKCIPAMVEVFMESK